MKFTDLANTAVDMTDAQIKFGAMTPIHRDGTREGGIRAVRGHRHGAAAGGEAVLAGLSLQIVRGVLHRLEGQYDGGWR